MMVSVQDAYKAYKAGLPIRVTSVEKCRMTASAKKWFGQIIPEGAHFRHWIENYQFWTDTHPQFEIVEPKKLCDLVK